ncbi:hypothetical protein [Pseudophaeobacter sp.]|uniref:hypothetical protein n=1 Tax=Pseudophaeobacter sp. TaxID=1971739 RepID=UPI003296A4F6
MIYCRVSGAKQVREGDGLASQENRCREYATYNDYDVVEVFTPLKIPRCHPGCADQRGRFSPPPKFTARAPNPKVTSCQHKHWPSLPQNLQPPKAFIKF